jgi:succinate-semialdehyde dehydrogenase / glutarate-semialdehyde dehydrogenase
MVAKMCNGDESCIGANRFFVHEPIASGFVDRLAARMIALCIGLGGNSDNEVGLMINAAACADIGKHVKAWLQSGARVLTGDTTSPGTGSFLMSSALAHVRSDDRLIDREFFGPAAPTIRFATQDRELSPRRMRPPSRTPHVDSANVSLALREAEFLEGGTVECSGSVISDPAASFDCAEHSGLDGEGGYEWLLEFLENKYISIAW